ncbi:MAG: urate oxidase [Acidobacteria bacterium]|nr:urate oxidase [Acidobacteriota bacterium]
MLAQSAYGKSRVRLVQVRRHGDRHDLRDLTVAIQFKGHYDESYTDGDNSAVLPTDTMKNTVYALAAREPVDDPERFGLALARRFLDRNARLVRARIDLTEHLWRRIPRGEREHGHAFMRTGPETRTAAVQSHRRRTIVEAGIADLLLLKSADSAFDNFMRDEYTTLPETRDRIMATSLTATWRYSDPDIDFGPAWNGVRRTLLEVFAEHESESVQHTLHAMGQAVLDNIEHVTAIHLVMPNKHHLPFDLTHLGLTNKNEIFVPTDEPHGLIEATLLR